MTRPVLLALLLCVAVLTQMVEAWPAMSHRPNQPLAGRAGPAVEPMGWNGLPWLSRLAATTTTTTTLTLPVSGPTSAPSLTAAGFAPTGLPGTASGTTPSPDAGNSKSRSTVVRQTSSEALETDTMPTDSITTSTGTPATTAVSGSLDAGDSGIGSNRTLAITLGTVLSAVGLVLIAGTILLCRRRRRSRRLPFLARGISPIDDDEIERWKSPRDEKARFPGGDTDAEADAYAAFDKETGGGRSHAKHPSTSSVKKPPSVIIYSRPHDGQAARHSTDAESRRSIAQNHPAYTSYNPKTSFDKALPQTPIQARAPNARAGLTDESVPGDDPFIPSLKRTPSRLSKLPPNLNMGRRGHHARARSSRSSTRSFGGDYYYYGGGGGSRTGSDLELSSPRHSHDHIRHTHSQHGHSSRSFGAPRSSHSRVYSSSSIPPRLSFGDEVLYGGLSPARPRIHGEGEIGRAIG